MRASIAHWEAANDFLLRVRTDLHYLARRSADALTLNFQGQIADRFNYPQANTLRRSEAFMRDYYHHARSMALVTETLFERLVHTDDQSSGLPKPVNGFAAPLWLRPARAGIFRWFLQSARDDLPGSP